MKLKYSFFLLFCLIFATASAQTLEQARAMFTQGKYDEAKPVFERYVKSAPNNANYNYWYGVCCLKTGEPEKSIKHLEFAHKRKIQNAPLFLGMAFDELYRFDEAVNSFEEYRDAIVKKKVPTDEVDELLEKSRLNARMIKGVENVTVIDSIVVDKATFLQAYKISEESGRLYMFDDYFNTASNPEATVYETELGNKIYYAEKDEDGMLSIFTRNKLFDEWSHPTELPANINANADVNYPFVMTDGITICYAADGPGSIGGYDIFVTRYNSSSETYLSPENVGMPFNSPFNDYMYVVDEFNNLGWFASDRFQPDDKVCIYVFVPNTSKVTYNYEGMEPEVISSLARLESIEATWKDQAVVDAAKERLHAVENRKPAVRKEYEFTFIINDKYTYHEAEDFRSPEALKMFRSYQQMEKDYRELKKKLESQRDAYTQASAADKKKMSPALLDLEKQVLQMYHQVENIKTNVRNTEIKTQK